MLSRILESLYRLTGATQDGTLVDYAFSRMSRTEYMQFSSGILERWRCFRQTIDALDLSLQELEDRSRASNGCVPLSDMLKIQRLVAAGIEEQVSFLEQTDERADQLQHLAAAQEHVQRMERVLRAEDD